MLRYALAKLKALLNPIPADAVQWAQEAQRQTKCPTSITIAQWALESGYGRSMPAGSNNPFGIKSTPGSKYPFVVSRTKEQLTNGKVIWVDAKFVKYPSIQEAFLAHGRMLMSPNGYFFKRVQPYLHDPLNFAKAISLPNRPAYASDQDYSQKLINEIKAYNLTQYDLKV